MASQKLMDAIEENEVEKVRKLLEGGANFKPTKAHEDCPLQLAAHYGAYDGDPEITKLLIAAGADVNYASKEGWTALHEACHQEAIEIARLLLEAGADSNAKLSSRYSIPEGPNCKKGTTPRTIWDDSEVLIALFEEFDGSPPAEAEEWFDTTAASIVYGRAVRLEGTGEQAQAWIAGASAKAASDGVEIRCIPTSDLSLEDGSVEIELAVGFLVAHVEADLACPMPVSSANFKKAQAQGEKVSQGLWKKLLEGTDCDLGQDCRFYLVAPGPLSYAMFVSGELCSEDEADADAGQFYSGRGMNQEDHMEGVVGESLASCDDHLEALDPSCTNSQSTRDPEPDTTPKGRTESQLGKTGSMGMVICRCGVQ